MRKGVLALEGTTEKEFFVGDLFGAEVSAASIRKNTQAQANHKDSGYGEVVFNTSMTGYQEVLTDPSYYGQIICMTVPHVGNTGVNASDPESKRVWCGGFLIHDLSLSPSSFRSEHDLDHYLKQAGIPGLAGIDTRKLTRFLRSRGATRGVILPFEERNEAAALLAELPKFEGRDMIREVTTEAPYHWKAEAAAVTEADYFPRTNPESKAQIKAKAGGKKHKVVAIDYGLKFNMLRNLSMMGCEVEVVPATMSAKDVLARKPDGVFLTNGPGDPAAAPYAVETVKGLIGNVPIFGVCMGHQILSLALGAKTFKLKFGHRGGNQPVLDQTTGKVEISSQNHGYAVDQQSLPSRAEVTHINLNDRTVEGIRVKDAAAFSVQYHPEACPGPRDSMDLFARFVEMMDNR